MQTNNIILQLMRSYLFDSDFSESMPAEQLKQVFLLLQEQDLAHLGSVVLSKNPAYQAQEEAFFRFQYMAMLRYEQSKYAKEQMYAELERQQIPFIPLKGAVLSDYYPEPWHRTSCDVDILVPEERLGEAVEALEKNLHYTYKGQGDHDASLYAPNGVYVELHYTLLEEGFSASDAWTSAVPVPGKTYHHMLSPEMFILHHIAHIARHFKYAGCGLRQLIDLWMIEEKMPYDKDKLEILLAQGGLKKLADSVRELLAIWFENAPSNEFFDRLSAYILEGGVYGKFENWVTLRRVDTGKFRHILSRIFLPYEVLRYQYPVLQRHRFLLPFYEVRRWFRLLKPGRIKQARHELAVNSGMGEEQRSNIAGLLAELELV